MSLFNLSVHQKPNFFCKVSALKTISPPSNRFKKTPSRDNFNFVVKIPFWRVSNGRKSQIFARFGGPSKRRNALRKKLIEDEKVRTSDTDSNSQNYSYINNESDDKFISNSNYGGLIETNFMDKGHDFDEIDIEKSDFENWVDRYNKDRENWGNGSGSVSTFGRDSSGIADRESVNADEISKGREFGNGFRSVNFRGESFMKISRIGFVVLCGYFVFWAMKILFFVGNNGVELELSREEKEMLRRKLRSRMEREKMKKSSVSSVEVVEDSSMESSMGSIERPRLDKNELMKSISEAQGSKENLAISNSNSNLSTDFSSFDEKILEIRMMARRARERERRDPSKDDDDEKENGVIDVVEADMDEIQDVANIDRKGNDVDDLMNENSYIEKGDGKIDKENSVGSLNNFSAGGANEYQGINGIIECGPVDDPETDDMRYLSEISPRVDAKSHDPKIDTVISSLDVIKDETRILGDQNETESGFLHTSDTGEEIKSHDKINDSSSSFGERSVRMKPRVIRSVEEAREYLSQKHGIRTDKGHPNQEMQIKSLLCIPNDGEPNAKTTQTINERRNVSQSYKLDTTQDPIFVMNPSEDFARTKGDSDNDSFKSEQIMTSVSKGLEASASLHAETVHQDDVEKNNASGDLPIPRTGSSRDSTDTGYSTEGKMVKAEESWMEKNFQEFEPIVKKIGVGFQENYAVAKEKVQEESTLRSTLDELVFKEDHKELEWMKDDGLREIVFHVRENELAGRDPFHLMDAEDQRAFFKGLEREVEKENTKLLNLHQYVHSRVENLDYGADGISLYDPPEKVIPRWKGPPIDKDPEFLNNFVEHRRALLNQDIEDGLQKSKEMPSFDEVSMSSVVDNLRKTSQDGASTNPKIIIEGSDGSIRAGKKSGKEYWQHTKKWSREFLELYNAETDPEVKSVMKDMGKDLDKWVTEKEIQDTADLMSRIPKRKRRYIEKKLEKVKREMKMFGPQAVVSKYREYAEETEEDYLWWLDLRFVLCIELYTIEDGVDQVGFYSLEMAADLELDPKQYHVIAFEDPGDSKNFCYIIQEHMEMLGKGRAFVVARPPKDTFREAKATGFSVTVIRKGELQLNVDQTLEEVEDEIAELGSKMYHDKIMCERSVDISTLMKGVFGAGKSTKRRSRRLLSKSTKPAKR